MKPKYFWMSVSVIVGLIVVVGVGFFAWRENWIHTGSIQGTQVPVSLVPEAGVSLPARYYASPGKVEDRGVILLHMLGGTQDVWNIVAADLQAKNYEVMTFNFRGHGGATGNWEEFSNEDFAHFVDDTKEAIRYLRDINKNMDIAIIGASLGANVAITVAAQDPSISAVALLSPAHQYRGITITELNTEFARPVLYVVSEADAESYKDTLELYETVGTTEKMMKVYPKSGHGTKMLKNEPGLIDEMTSWLDQTL